MITAKIPSGLFRALSVDAKCKRNGALRTQVASNASVDKQSLEISEENQTDENGELETDEAANDDVDYWNRFKAAFNHAYDDLEREANVVLRNAVMKRHVSLQETNRNGPENRRSKTASFGDALWQVAGHYLSNATWLSLYSSWMTEEDQKARRLQLDADRTALCELLRTQKETDYWTSLWREHQQCVQSFCKSIDSADELVTVTNNSVVSQLDGVNDLQVANSANQTDNQEHSSEAGNSSAAERRRKRVSKSANLWTQVSAPAQSAYANFSESIHEESSGRSHKVHFSIFETQQFELSDALIREFSTAAKFLLNLQIVCCHVELQPCRILDLVFSPGFKITRPKKVTAMNWVCFLRVSHL